MENLTSMYTRRLPSCWLLWWNKPVSSWIVFYCHCCHCCVCQCYHCCLSCKTQLSSFLSGLLSMLSVSCSSSYGFKQTIFTFSGKIIRGYSQMHITFLSIMFNTIFSSEHFNKVMSIGRISWWLVRVTLVVAFGFLPQNFGRWRGPTNGTLSFYEQRVNKSGVQRTSKWLHASRKV